MKRSFYIIIFVLQFAWAYGQKPLNILPDTMGVCQGDSVLVKFPEDIISSKATYEWTTKYGIIVNVKQLYIKRKGRYSVKIYDGSYVILDSTYLKVYEPPKIHLKDTTLCWGTSVKMEPPNKSYRYIWSTGDVNESIKIDHPGKFWVKAVNKGCTYTDTFRVTLNNSVIPNFGKEVLFCEGDENKTLSVKAAADVKLYWNTGAQTPSVNATREGIYWVKSISKACGKHTDSVTVKFKNCDCEMYIPTSFTPNDDDKNDYFFPVCQCEYQYFSLVIFDRWGNTVYVSNNINGKWDGKFKGNLCPDDIYVYKIEALQKNSDKKIIRSGHISLFR
ncbi:MAG: gliding motility-associated C-terminal domain-containing protein [Bacteroidetes bacterium]|nr:gliding motility-associated C-terminal domain-containing protein [Bacteroidota bacterium]